MIYTCSHHNYQSNLYKTYAISGNRGKTVNYQGECFSKLAPKLSFWQIWHNLIFQKSLSESCLLQITKLFLFWHLHWNNPQTGITVDTWYANLNPFKPFKTGFSIKWFFCLWNLIFYFSFWLFNTCKGQIMMLVKHFLIIKVSMSFHRNLNYVSSISLKNVLLIFIFVTTQFCTL